MDVNDSIQTQTDETGLLNFEYETSLPSIIKVIGVGGGGGNAVNHMYMGGIHDVSFVLCNTDNQALRNSPISRKIQLGAKQTAGLGAGNRPEIARLAAEESINEIHKMLDDGTRMVFITAGMGGGTGTGAAPVIAREAKSMDILTVGIVTIPFLFEGQKKIQQAFEGISEMKNHVDALLVINNERLRSIYNDLSFFNAFGKADDTLSTAAKSIAEIITVKGHVNLDFADVQTTLKNGGVALMSSGLGTGERRVADAIQAALNSPLLNNNKVYNAKKILFNMYFSKQSEPSMDEMGEVNNFMGQFSDEIEVIWGAAVDDTLGENIKFTVLATGFEIEDVTQDGRNRRSNNDYYTSSKATHLDVDREELQRKIIRDAYGEDAVEQRNAYNLRNNFYVFTLEDLEDDALIEKIEQTPTFSRERSFIQKIKDKTPIQPARIHEEKIFTEPDTTQSQHIITF